MSDTYRNVRVPVETVAAMAQRLDSLAEIQDHIKWDTGEDKNISDGHVKLLRDTAQAFRSWLRADAAKKAST